QSVAGEWEITFADTDPAAATAAANAVDGEVVSLTADDQFDAVCVAVPMSVVERAIETHAPRATQAVLDLSGVMAAPLAAMAEHAPELE
ncbi:prephenate dehydrogenase, partial [Enterococcus hirae]